MHALICGLGSIGRRHQRHLLALGVDRVDAFRTGRARLSDEGQPSPRKTFYDLDTALAEHPDVVVVANPTSLHLETASRAVVAGCHVLIEKPLSHSLENVDALCQLARRQQAVVAVAENLRYHPSLLMLREWIRTEQPFGPILLLRCHFGTYFPAWHPWEDCRSSYAARRDLGGGCRRTHIHEIGFTLWMMGEVESTRALESHRRTLGTDVDETMAYLIRHASGAISVISLSLAVRPPRRVVSAAFEEGTVDLDLFSGEWKASRADGSTFEGGPPAGFEFDHTYRDQDLDFLKAVRGEGLPAVSVEEAAKVLRIALAGEEGGNSYEEYS